MALIEIRDLTFTYPECVSPALSGIDLDVEDGEFLLLCGASGSGKSTLLRQLKPALTPFGKKSGGINYGGSPIGQLDERRAAAEIGFVMQDPESQTVTDKVWHELAFGLENLGTPPEAIRRRVAEMASFFGIQGWFDRSVSELSGGQLQMLSLASVMVMQPRVLILDEPTSQLDPIAAADFLETIKRVNRELSLTVILSEHRLEEVFTAADRVGVMEDGRIICCGTPAQTVRTLGKEGERHQMFAGFPAAARIWAGTGEKGECPLTVRDGARWLGARYVPRPPEKPPEIKKAEGAPALKLREVWFRYEKELPDALTGAGFEARAGQISCLLGANGAGKSTALGAAAGIYRPYRGKVELLGKNIRDYGRNELYGGTVGMLPQNPQLFFVRDTVGEDLEEMAKACGAWDRLEEVTGLLGLGELIGRHPYDLSGGEQQKAAFAKLLLRSPKIILLDEPTKGLDAYFKKTFAALLRKLADGGAAVVMATHDVEFAAEYADKCIMFFNGAGVSEDAPGPFFAGNSFYTTAANRIARRVFPDAVTCGEVIEKCLEYGEN